MKNIFFKHAFCAATISALTLGSGVAQSKDKLTFAVPSFLTGGAAGPFGIPAKNGAEMVANAINAGKLPAPYNTKGFGGASVDLIFRDEGGGATKQVAEYRNLVQKHPLSKNLRRLPFLLLVEHLVFLKKHLANIFFALWVMQLLIIQLQPCTLKRICQI